MRQLDPFPQSREDDGMIADHIAAAQRMHPKLGLRPLAGHSLASMPRVPLITSSARFERHLGQPPRRSARRVFLEPVVHFDDLDIESLAEHLDSLIDQLE